MRTYFSGSSAKNSVFVWQDCQDINLKYRLSCNFYQGGLCERKKNHFKRVRYYNSVIDELLNYFQDSNPYYRTEHFPRLVERVNYYKVQREGVEVMCEVVDEIVNEVVNGIVDDVRRESERNGEIRGEIRGEMKGKKNAVMEVLEEMGKLPQWLIQKIQKETDLAVLSRWLKCAAKANSIQEFETNM